MDKSKRAVIFVHGFLGWGERDGLYSALPYWGLTSGDLLAFLREQGYECRAASVGSLSSAWDRACELYAQLCGGMTDYGVAHAKKFGHERFGVSYPEPLLDDCQSRSIDLIGHSFGGATVRLFLDILANGRPEEISAARELGVEPSPFFLGGHAGCIHSLSAIAAPHNGTTLIDSSSNLTALLMRLFSAAAKTFGVWEMRNGYDFKLEQFGIRRVPGEPVSDALLRCLSADFIKSGDHALRDLSIDGAEGLNRQLSVMPDVYYFSYPCCRTHISLIGYHHLPDSGMTPIFTHYSASMGRWYDRRTPGGRKIGKDWLLNDGLVNTISAMYPRGEAFRVYGKDDVFSPCVWNIGPVRRLDHFAVIGGVFNADKEEIQRLFLEILGNIDRTYR